MQDSDNRINPNEEQVNEVSFVEIVVRYIKFWKLFVISVILCVALAFVYLQYTTLRYKVTSTVIVSDGNESPSGIEVTAFKDLGIFSQSGDFSNEIEILKSRTLMKRVVDSLKLNVSYYKKDFFKMKEIYKKSPVLVDVNDFKKAGHFIVDKAEGNTLMISATAKDTAFTKKIFIGEVFSSPWGLLTIHNNPEGKEEFPIVVSVLKPNVLPQINIASVKGASNVVEMSITSANIEKGIDIVNTLIDIYNMQVIKDKNSVATNTISFINDRLEVISQSLDNAEKDVETYKRDRNITDLQTEAHLFVSATNEYEKKVSEIDVQSSILRTIKDLIIKAQDTENIIPVNIGLSDPTIIKLINTYNDLLMDKKRSTAGMKPGNPTLKEYESRIATLKENLSKGIDVEEAKLKSVRSELSKQGSLYTNKIKGVSTQERESKKLYRQKDLMESLFTYLLQKREETGLSLALATPNAKVIDKAIGGVLVYPQRNMFLLGGLLVGLIIPICIIFIINLFKVKIESKEELLSVVKAPFLGEVPISKNDESFPVKELRSRCAENFRIITANLGFLLGEEDSKVILVTSTMPREGKSFFARNFALSLATSGHKTLLIDADIRKSKLDSVVNFHVDKGLAQYLADPEVQIDDIIEKTGDWSMNLHIIPTKLFPPNPAELLASKRLDTLFTKVKEQYKYIIVDTPPVGLVADAFRINQFVNASIYVTRINATHKDSLKEIRDLYVNKKLYNMSCVLNGVPRYNRYGYRTSDYYHEAK